MWLKVPSAEHKHRIEKTRTRTLFRRIYKIHGSVGSLREHASKGSILTANELFPYTCHKNERTCRPIITSSQS